MPEAIIRATTFPISTGSNLSPAQYNSQIRGAIRVANQIYENRPRGMPRISFRLSTIMTYGQVIANMSPHERANVDSDDSTCEGLLSRSVRSLFRRNSGGLLTWGRHRRIIAMNETQLMRNRYGAGRFDWGGYTVELLGDQPNPDNPGRTGRASDEALRILRLNRVNEEIATYWVPGFGGLSASGVTFFPEAYIGITHQTEGIIMGYNVAPDVLAHELGHLLMRAGHKSFEVDPETGRELPVPVTNLMYGTNSDRLQAPGGPGRDITRGQINRMLSQSQRYLRS